VKTIRIILVWFPLVAAGCSTDLPARDADEPDLRTESGREFDPARSGRVTGRVTWRGPIPNPPGFLHGVPRTSGPGFEFRTAENPNRPRIDPQSRAVAGAVVYLRGVKTTAARPWNLEPVAVEIGNSQIAVVQGSHRGRVGFVRRGDSIAVSSTEAAYLVLRGRGDAFFSLPLPEPNHPVVRTLTKSGRIELTSGSGMYWANADLFVSDHPYFALTDADGRFALDRVPSGPVEVVVWMPGWKTAKTERDPDSTQVARHRYSPSIEHVVDTMIGAGESANIDVTVPTRQ
jgi:hypothetical protein